MSEPTPPGSAPQEPPVPSAPSFEPPAPSAPPSAPYSPPAASGGYTAPPPGPAPVGYSNPDDKTWALIAHFGGALTWFIAPLIALLVKGNESPTVKAHATAALNFQVLWTGINLVCICIGTCLGWLLLPLVLYFVPLFPLIMGILAGVKANNGELPKYPLTMNLIK
ncbi:DUF4870 domain-containing protein [Catellatospora sp. KI3]|uniref:DUF4870 domain-containing protein n=1 Tax=Catellatospora sp. KI3 TaxID=3041620 RepID=UPI0024821E2E|nr:DUF4870 domain-containing protein [Catellatospora sp. KI3]MDI1465597.1 DUF4870 domain-containing protein [Catellatospora sp. KI3]